MNLSELAAELRFMGGSLDKLDLTEELVAAREQIAQDTFDSFTGSRTPEGTPWPPRKHYYPWKPLWKTGTLMQETIRQIQQGIISNNSLKIVIADPPYAIFHQAGTSIMPARRFFGMTQDTKDRILESVRKKLFGKLNKVSNQ